MTAAALLILMVSVFDILESSRFGRCAQDAMPRPFASAQALTFPAGPKKLPHWLEKPPLVNQRKGLTFVVV
jgi:hypothetical protein